MINILISNSTKVEDLLQKTIIDKDENKDIIITTSKTKLYEALIVMIYIQKHLLY